MNEWDRLHRQAEWYKAEYPPGTRILLLRMGDDPRPVEDNMRGTVVAVDSIGTIHCAFDNGRQLGVIPGEDSFRPLTAEELKQEQNAALLEDFRKKTVALSEVEDFDSLDTSPDFQCDQTGGYPTSLTVNWTAGKAWLELNDSMANKRGRTTIPLEIREQVGFAYNDLLSFTVEGDAVIVRREKVCDDCADAKKEAFDDFFDRLPLVQQQALVSHLAQKVLRQKGGRYGRH